MAFRKFIYSTTETALNNAMTAKTVTNDDIAFVNENGVMFIKTQGVKFPCGYSKAEADAKFITTTNADNRYLKLTGGTLTGDLRIGSGSGYSTKWYIDFTLYADDTISYSSTDTLTYSNITSYRVSVNGLTKQLYAPNEWILKGGRLVTYSNGSRPIFIKNEYDSNYIKKGDKLVIIGSCAAQSGVVDQVKTPTTYIDSITTTVDSGVYTETIIFSSSHTNVGLPIFLYKAAYIKQIYYYSQSYSKNLWFNLPHLADPFIYAYEKASKSTLKIMNASLVEMPSLQVSSVSVDSSSDNYFLLGGGGTVARSNYLTSDVKYLPLTGGTLTGSLTAPSFLTGTSDSAYFQTKKMRGEGDASTYYHAVDWGYSGHNQVDFYEYGGVWNFWSNQSSTAGGTKVGSITTNGWEGSAALTGTPTAPTAAAGTSTTQIATTAFVDTAVDNAQRVYQFTTYDGLSTPTIATDIPSTATDISLLNIICFYSKSNVFLAKVTYAYNDAGHIAWFRIKNGYAVGSIGQKVVNTKLDDKYVQNSAPDASAIYVCTGNNVIYRGTSSGLTQMYGSLATKSSLSFSELTNKPTTLSGYGIIDAVPATGPAQVNGDFTVIGTVNADDATIVGNLTINNPDATAITIMKGGTISADDGSLQIWPGNGSGYVKLGGPLCYADIDGWFYCNQLYCGDTTSDSEVYLYLNAKKYKLDLQGLLNAGLIEEQEE